MKLQADKLLTEQEVAEITGISRPSLRRWRRVGEGPPFLRLCGTIRYDPDDLRRWLRSSKREKEHAGDRRAEE